MQSTAINLEFKLNVNLRLVKPDFMQSTAVNLEFKPKVIFKLLSCNRPIDIKNTFFSCFTHVAIPYTSRFFLYDCHLLVNVIMPCSCILYMPVILFLKKQKLAF